MSSQSSEEDTKSHNSTFNLNAPEFKPKQKIALTDTNNNNVDDDEHGKNDDKVSSNLKSTNVVPIYNSTPYIYYINPYNQNNQIIMPSNYQMAYLSTFGGWPEHNGNITVPIQLPIDMYTNNGSTLLQHPQLDNSIYKDNTNKLHEPTTCINADSTTIDTNPITTTSITTNKDPVSGTVKNYAITTTDTNTVTTTDENPITTTDTDPIKSTKTDPVTTTHKDLVTTTDKDPVITTDTDPVSTTVENLIRTSDKDNVTTTDKDPVSNNSTVDRDVVITTCNDNNNSANILPSSSCYSPSASPSSASASDTSYTIMSTNTINNNIHNPIQLASMQHPNYYYYNASQFPVTLSTTQSPPTQISPLTLAPHLLQQPSPVFPSQNIIIPSYSPLLSPPNIYQQQQQQHPTYLHNQQQQQQHHQSQLHPQQQLLQYLLFNHPTNINQKHPNSIINNSINLKSFKFNTGDKKLDNHLKNLVQSINPDVSRVFQAKLTENNSRFYVVKSFTEENVLLGIRHSAWCSTKNGNDVLQQAYQSLHQQNQDNEDVHLFLFFSINGSGFFSGVAEITDQLQSTNNIWTHKKWQSGYFPIHWHYVKQIPNSQLRHIKLEHNDNRPVTNSRDVTEIKPFIKGVEMLRIFHSTPYDKSLVLSFQQPGNLSFSSASSVSTTASNTAATT